MTSQHGPASLKVLKAISLMSVLLIMAAMVLVTAPSSTAASSTTPDPSARIIGGEDARDGEFPFMVSLQQPGRLHWCGGTLVSPTQVLTARHCVHEDLIPILTAVIGRTQISSDTGVERSITRVDHHPTLDASILTLSEPVTSIDPVQLPDLASDAPVGAGAIGVAIGWGITDMTDPDPQAPDWLQKVDAPIFSPAFCGELHYPDIDTNTEVCAGGKGEGVCYGDSGGPLLRLVNGEVVQVGVVSRGLSVECADVDGAAIFVYTGSHALWEGLPPLTP